MVSFNKHGERDSFGITYVLENAQAPPVAGASRRGADEALFLLCPNPGLTYIKSRLGEWINSCQ